MFSHAILELFINYGVFPVYVSHTVRVFYGLNVFVLTHLYTFRRPFTKRRGNE